MKSKRWFGPYASVGLGAAFACVSGTAGASGFALIEQGASGQGNAYAGAAAVAEDATTLFFNPAGITRIEGRQVVVAGHIIAPQSDFSNDGSLDATGGTLLGGDDDGGQTAFVPNFYIVTDVWKNTKFGLGVHVPFGLETEYDDDWVGRYHAIKSDVLTVNINPTLAYKFNDQFSIGVGVSAQYIDAELTNAIDFGTICVGLEADGTIAPGTCAALGLSPQSSDGEGEVEGDDWGYGFNLGALYEFTPATRIGAAYRSKIEHTLECCGKFDVPANFALLLSGFPSPQNTLFSDTDAEADVDLPDSFSLSVYHDLNDRLAIMADWTYTWWNKFDELRVEFENPVQPDAVTEQDWDNTNRYSVGLTYTLNPRWKLRGGLAYDETPIPDEELRTARIPGNDRTWLSLGAGWTPSPNLHFDVGYSHLFIDDTDIENTESTPDGALLKGEYDNSVDIFSAQVVWNF